MTDKKPSKTAGVARVLKTDERAAKRQATAKRREEAKQARAKDRKARGGKAEQEHLYNGRSPAQAARDRADREAGNDRKARAARTNGRDEGLYGGQSEAGKARGRAADKAARDRASQAGRVARGGLHSSASATDRKSTKAQTTDREGLYDNNSPAARSRGRADNRAAGDAKSQAKRRVGSPEYQAEKQRQAAQKQREAEEKKRQAEAKAKELEARAKQARAHVASLTGKERRAARQEAEDLEAQARQARAEAAGAKRDAATGDTAEQEHLYSGQSRAAASRETAAQKVQARQDHLYTSPARTAVTEAPVSVPPVVERGSAALQTACTRQAWDNLETSIALLS
jgi:hypothetical protein